MYILVGTPTPTRVHTLVPPYRVCIWWAPLLLHGYITWFLPIEYAYGGHPYSYTGVYSMQPKEEAGISTDGGVRFKETLEIGYTTMPESEVAELIQSMGLKYNGNTYNVFHKYVSTCILLLGGDCETEVDTLLQCLL